MTDDKFRDFELTNRFTGKRVLVNAFDIAAVNELDNGCELVLKVAVAATRVTEDIDTHVTPYAVRVSETYDQIKQMRAEVNGRGALAPPAQTHS